MSKIHIREIEGLTYFPMGDNRKDYLELKSSHMSR